MKRPSKREQRQQQRAELGKRTFNEKFSQEREVLQRKIVPQNEAQADFLDILNTRDICIARGSAGCGKSFLATTYAANEYLKNPNLKIYMSRAYVPMGRTVGMLKGTELEKISPFLAPMMNILKDHLGKKYDADFGKNIDIQLTEAIRGIDLKDAILLVDEAQNLTRGEIKSIVTRLNKGGKVIFMGDTRQADIPKEESGLDWLIYMADKYNIQGVDWVDFYPEHCVRSGIVKQFLMAFDEEGV